MTDSVIEKLKVLAESAKYDVSCASSGTSRPGKDGHTGSAAGWGICHSFTADGRCVSLLKIMLTNNCIYDCAYCINRHSIAIKERVNPKLQRGFMPRRFWNLLTEMQ